MSDSEVEVTVPSPKKQKLASPSKPPAAAAAAASATSPASAAAAQTADDSMEGEESSPAPASAAPASASSSSSSSSSAAAAAAAAATSALLRSHHVSLAPSFSSATFDYPDRANINQFLLCALCSNPLYQPLEHTKCRMAYCSACLVGSAEEGGEAIVPAQCPECKEAIVVGQNTASPSKIVALQLDALVVKCRACKTQLKRGEYEQHWRTQCPVACPFSVAGEAGAAATGCAVKLPRAELNAHIDVCAFAPVQCEAQAYGCAWQGQREAQRAHSATCSHVACIPSFKRLIAAHGRELAAKDEQITKLQVHLNTREMQLQSFRDAQVGLYSVGTIIDALDTENQSATCTHARALTHTL